MRNVRILAAGVLIPVAISGCSTFKGATGGGADWCALAGAAAGVAIGAGAADGGVGGGIIGAASGAVLGEIFCHATGVAAAAPMAGDTDGDGVDDDQDQCPGTPAGAPVDSNGCPLYSDGDSVPDYLDKCPGTPSGVSVDADGCPIDTDGDGVPDGLDQCPGTPAGAVVDANGCSEVGQALAVLSNVNFDLNSDQLRADDQPALEEVLGTLQANPSIAVDIVGHTDSSGAAAYNQDLSVRRAESVRGWLNSRGISADRMTASGMGEEQPIASNETKEGRAENRRVEFTVTGK